MKPKAVAHIPERKKKEVEELKNLFTKKRTVLLASIRNIPASQFQIIGKKLRGKAIVKVPKKNLALRAIDSTKKEHLLALKGRLEDSIAFLFSDLDSFELAGELLKNQSPSKAKPGQEAPKDIEIQEGPTELVPGPAISELGALGIQIQIEKGKIHIKESKIIVKEGEKIKQAAADIMAKFDIKPFSVGFSPLCAFDSEENLFYDEISIDPEGVLTDLKHSFAKALAFAVAIGYTTAETVPIMIQKAAAQEKRLNRIMSGEPEEEVAPAAPAEEIKEDAT